ncbi:HNH endonuclease signature motif containing protein [Pseudonocardia lacus]|uniref:HNH endonuclease signature motif containing protein n=1 Tax=Pseudonocardia lacus TaxID=2835865 RepID=UPI001BDC0F3C|nr:HNH endonuclease signature motif containing protein [Pseudonocardia lacus]
MIPTELATAGDLLREVAARLRENGSGMDASEVIAALAATRELSRLVSQIQVETVAVLRRSGAFAAAGHARPESAVASVLGVDRGRAREIVRVAEHLDAATSPAMAAAFRAGAASLEQVDRTAQLAGSAVARRLPAGAWAGIEQQIAAAAGTSTARELAKYGTELVHAYDRVDSDEDREPVQVNELHLTPLPGGGGKIHGIIEDPVRFASIAAVIDAKAAPRTAEDQRTGPERAADALAEVCGFVADHGDKVLPSTGGWRPHLLLTVELADLENRAQAACLDFGGHLDPAGLRMLCCDAAVTPIVMNGTGKPLDVGRTQRIIPPAIRKAITARDRGCAHPGCDRPPSWSEIHHIREWSQGGATRVDNLVMLCRLHHREIHATAWTVRIAADGLPEFIPPAWVDANRTPRRHPRITPDPDSPCPVQAEPVRRLTHAGR